MDSLKRYSSGNDGVIYTTDTDPKVVLKAIFKKDFCQTAKEELKIQKKVSEAIDKYGERDWMMAPSPVGNFEDKEVTIQGKDFSCYFRMERVKNWKNIVNFGQTNILAEI